MSFSLIVDLIVVALLIPTIIYAVILNNRLAVLRKNREELARLIAAFNEATGRAETGIPRLRKVSEEAAQGVQEKVARAQVLRDDLAFMVERAEAMANRLEQAIRTGRTEAKAPAAAGGAAGAAGPAPARGLDIESAAEAAARADADSRKRLGAAVERERSGERPLERPAAAQAPRARQSLGAALAADAGGGPRAGLGGDGPAEGHDDRSEAERELLRALQSAR